MPGSVSAGDSELNHPARLHAGKFFRRDRVKNTDKPNLTKQTKDETKIISIWFRHWRNTSVSAILVGGISAIQAVLGILAIMAALGISLIMHQPRLHQPR